MSIQATLVSSWNEGEWGKVQDYDNRIALKLYYGIAIFWDGVLKESYDNGKMGIKGFKGIGDKPVLTIKMEKRDTPVHEWEKGTKGYSSDERKLPSIYYKLIGGCLIFKDQNDNTPMICSDNEIKKLGLKGFENSFTEKLTFEI